MGYDLRDWALRVEHPCLTPRTRQVLAAVCLVAHDEHGEFWMRGKNLIEEHLPDMSYGSYRNCLSRLVRSGLLIKTEHGGGRIAAGGGTTTRYRVNSPVVRNPHPAQGVLPEITRSPDAQARPSEPEAGDDRLSVSAGDVYQRVSELLAVGITPDQMMAFLEAVPETMTGLRNTSRTDEETCHEPEKHVMNGDMFPTNTSGVVTGSGRETRHDSKKCVTDHDKFSRNVSQIMTPLNYMRKKIHEEKEEAAAAADMSRSEHEGRDFFELLAGSLAKAGHPGIRAAQFADLRGFLGEYETLTSSPPDERTAEYIAGRVHESRGVRNVVGLARRITEDVLRTGEGYVERVQASVSRSPPPQAVAEPAPDWELLHLAHVEQVSPAGELWDSVLEVLRSQVPRPAFETWLSETRGWAHADGKFVVGTPNSFVVEMLWNRMHSLVQRALRDVIGAELSIGYAVAPGETEPCPHCHAQIAAS